jgi:Flp pilus assembly protein TadD
MSINDPFSRAVAHFNSGLAHLAAGAAEHAEASFRQAIEAAPNLAEAHANLGLALDRRGEKAQAETAYRQAIALGANNPELFLNLGALLAATRRFSEAEAVYGEGLRLNPQVPSLWSNLGALHAGQKREEQAEACFRSALALDPEYASARFNLSYLLLRQGHFAEGFASLEARNWYATFTRELTEQHGIPRWQGDALTGKSILITCEAGHGDMIQFCRYARDLKIRGAASVAVLCQPALQRLFATLDGVDEIFSLGQAVPEAGWDFWSPLLSLPHYFNTRPDNIPARIPYLAATPEDLAKWQARIPAWGLRVGLAWKGSPKFENDSNRSIPHLSLLAPLWSVPGTHFISLQKGAGEEEISTLTPASPITALGPDLQDFADTAAVISQLDLVISVDTAIAHLAGALGKPCWLLLPDFMTDWRWLKQREDSPWYPAGMRLFRQKKGEDWRPAIARVEAALTAQTH